MISAGPITIDPEKREARVHGDLLLLAVDEYHLLASLAAEPHREWTRSELLAIPDALGHGWLKWVARTARREAHPRRHRARPSPH